MANYTKEEINAKILEIQNMKSNLEREATEVGKELAVAEASFNNAKAELITLCPQYEERINAGDFDSIKNETQAELEKVLASILEVEASVGTDENIRLD